LRVLSQKLNYAKNFKNVAHFNGKISYKKALIYHLAYKIRQVHEQKNHFLRCDIFLRQNRLFLSSLSNSARMSKFHNQVKEQNESNEIEEALINKDKQEFKPLKEVSTEFRTEDLQQHKRLL
jgi:hypothetical protein